MRKQLITIISIGLLSTISISASRILDRGPNLHFGTVNAVGTNSITRDLNLTNNGDEDLTITGISFHEYGRGAYTTVGWNSGVIAPGESQLVPIKFDPDEAFEARNYNIAVYIHSDKTNAGDRDRILFGESIIEDNISTCDNTRILNFGRHLVFGDTDIGTTKEKILTLKNDGNCDLNITGITYHKRTKGKFTGNYVGIIPPHSSQDVTITYAPTELTNDSGVLYVNSDKTNTSKERSRALIGGGI